MYTAVKLEDEFQIVKKRACPPGHLNLAVRGPTNASSTGDTPTLRVVQEQYFVLICYFLLILYKPI